MRLVFAQAVNNEFPIGNILTTFKNSIKIFVTFDAVAFFKPQLPLLNLFYYTIFQKNQSHSGNRYYLNTDKSKGKV